MYGQMVASIIICLHSPYNQNIKTMSNDFKSIHEFDFTLICNYFKALKRQGPGSPEVTQKAVSFINELSDKTRIADIGCGTGGQTMALANYTKGQITGIDLFPDFIELFNKNAIEAHCEDRVKGIVGSMDALPFQEEELDLIWSEGAIYNIGFERGMNEWNKFLKKNGFIAVTEASWFTQERPSEIEDFWMANYPEIDTIPRKIMQMEKAGYIPTAHFILPENCWTEHFYAPQFPVQEAFLKEYAGNDAAADLITGQRYEESLYNKYKEYYGYVFYIGQKRD